MTDNAVPEDIKMKAAIVLSYMGIGNTATNRSAVERAILDERERCLTAVYWACEYMHDERDMAVKEEIADSIRFGYAAFNQGA